jgi:hypothetical protein
MRSGYQLATTCNLEALQECVTDAEVERGGGYMSLAP